MERNHRPSNIIYRLESKPSVEEAALEKSMNSLNSIQRIHGIESGQPDLKSALLAFIPDIFNQPQTHRTVIAVLGESGNGKTKLRERINSALEIQTNHVKLKYSSPNGFLSKGFITNIPTVKDLRVEFLQRSSTWEDGEEDARSLGLVWTDRKEPFEVEELKNSALMEKLSIRKNIYQSLFTDIEVVGIPIENKLQNLIERPLGYQLVRQLFTYTDVFSSHGSIGVPKYKPYGMVQIGGNLLKLMIGPVRDKFKNAQTLEEAQRIAEICGLEIPQADTLKEMQAQGASLEQIKNNETAIDLHVQLFERKGYIKPCEPEIIEHVYKAQVEPLVSELDIPKEQSLKTLERSLMLGRYFEYLFKDIHVPSHDYLIGFNNPDFDELGIKRENIPLVRDLIAEYQK